MTKKWGVAIIVLTLIGIGLSLYLTSLHYTLMLPGKEVDSICTMSATVDCAAVNTSQYAHIGRIPVSGLGVVFYAICLLFTLIGLKRRSLFIYLFLLSIPALLITGYMAAASSRLGLICLFCLAMALINVALFFLFPKAAGISWKHLGSAMRNYFASPLPFLGWGIATLVILGIGAAVLAKITIHYEQKRAALIDAQKRQPTPPIPIDGFTDAQLDEIVANFYKQPSVTVEIPADRPRQGDPDTPLTLIEFVDYQCPACKNAAETLPAFLHAHYPNQFIIIHMDYPLDNACNPNIKRRMHAFACEAAKIGVCVDRLSDNFWEYEELAFANQSQISSQKLRGWASELGIEETALSQCLTAPETTARIVGDITIGGKVPVTGTPTLLLNGRNLQGMWRDPVLFKRIIERELKSVE